MWYVSLQQTFEFQGGASWDPVLLYWIWAVTVSVLCGGRVKVTAAQLNIETLLSHTPSLSVSLFLSSSICQSLPFYLFPLPAQLHLNHFILSWSSYFYLSTPNAHLLSQSCVTCLWMHGDIPMRGVRTLILGKSKAARMSHSKHVFWGPLKKETMKETGGWEACRHPSFQAWLH